MGQQLRPRVKRARRARRLKRLKERIQDQKKTGASKPKAAKASS